MKLPQIKSTNLVLLIMSATVFFGIVFTLIMMAISKVPTNEVNIQLRIKLIDTIQMLVGGLIAIVTILVQQGKDIKPQE